MSGLPFTLIGAASNQTELLYIWDRATVEAKAILAILFIFSIVVWWTMTFKVLQMRRARKLNAYFGEEFGSQKTVLEMFSGKPHPEATKAASVFGGGIGGSTEELCGAFTGGVIALGYLLGREAPGDNMRDAGALVKEFKSRFQNLVSRRGTQRAIVAIGHKVLKTVFVLLSRQVPYHDSTVDYEALAVKRNAPRWIKQLRKFGYLPKMA